MRGKGGEEVVGEIGADVVNGTFAAGASRDGGRAGLMARGPGGDDLGARGGGELFIPQRGGDIFAAGDAQREGARGGVVLASVVGDGDTGERSEHAGDR